jgi:hypothetical protein
LLATFLVTTTADSGSSPLSLRQAIIDSNASPGLNTIDFAIGAVGSQQTITPASALPGITHPILVDGWSQGGAGYTSAPLVVIDGTSAGTADGFDLTTGSGGSTLRGLVVTNFSGAGFSIATTGNTIQGSYIGTNAGGTAPGTTPMANGIVITSAGNTIGGATAAAGTVAGNVISGTAGEGIEISGATAINNVVAGNLIGTDETGEVAVGNTDDGILLSSSTGNTIGGPTAASRNVIAADGLRGIELDSANSNLVENNFIGTDITGSTAMGVGHNGIYDASASNTFVSNVIDSSGNIGLWILGNSTLVEGNLIGLNAAGMAALGNAGDGIAIGSSSNTIGGTSATARNIVSGTLVGNATGIVVNSGTGNLIEGNYVGTNVYGTGALPNGTGINVLGGTGTTIGGATSTAGTGAGNVISGNAGDGLDLSTGSSDTTVIGNIIGLDHNGSVALENGSSTVGNGISTGATGDTIGGTIAADRNLISGNYLRGILLGGTDEIVEGNYIGTDYTGLVAIGNGLVAGYAGIYVQSADNTIGGSVAGAGNLLDGSGTEGIRIDTASAIDNLVAGNFIGVNGAGTGALPNHDWGVLISNGATGNTIGGPTTAYANVISGNALPGVDVDGAATTGDAVANDWIGTDAGGTGTLLNGSDALEITNGASALVLGSFTGDVLNQGTLGFFDAPSVITITGNYTQSAAGVLDVDLGGTSLSQYDQLQVSGTATLAGTLAAQLIDGFSISPLEEFQILTYATVAGAFATDDYPNGVTLYPGYGPTSLFLYSTPFELVTNTADTGAGSLRQAMTSANALSNHPTWIVFNIPTSDPGDSSGVWTIAPDSALPNLSAQVVLDGTTQPGFTPAPIIVLSGGSAGASATGLTVVAGGSGSTIRGFVVNDFAQDGINLDGASNTTVEGNYIGTTTDGTAANGNAVDGVEIDSGATGNTIGGTTSAARNIISGNNAADANDNGGVDVTDAGTANNVIAGNWIGLGSGGAALGNDVGITINLGATNNTIGGMTSVTGTGAGNVISGNGDEGVLILYVASTGNVVEGNLLGTDPTGKSVAGAQFDGVYLGSPNNTIGGSTSASRNVISGNTGSGIEDSGSDDLIEGNFLGTDINGSFPLVNFNDIAMIGSNNTIGGLTATPGTGPGNVISGTTKYSVASTGSGILIEGNLFGTDAAGKYAIPTYVGMRLQGMNDTVGGTTIGARNIISAAGLVGVQFDGAGVQDDFIEGNFIGTDITGNVAIPNRDGVNLANGASSITVANNVISGNIEDALGIGGGSNISVYGNLIGTNAAGTGALGNGWYGVDIEGPETGTTIGGTTVAARNIISENALGGISITLAGASGNTVEGNFIGTDIHGTSAFPNKIGVLIAAPATGNTIGGTATGAGNVISGNTGDGVEISGTGATANVVVGDFIGTDIFGTLAVANGGYGVAINTGASANIIGGTTAAARNIISANVYAGVYIDDSNDNLVEGDYIGTDMTGTVALANASQGGYSGGVDIVNFASANTIGGLTATPGTGAGNLISGNIGAGVALYDAGPNNLVAGNLIGTDVTGSVALGNDYAYGSLSGGFGVDAIASPDTIVGEPGGGNVIAGNGLNVVNGVNVHLIYSTGSVVQSNEIGTDKTGTVALSTTTYYGVALEFGSYIVGGLTPTPGKGLGNVISGNGGYGIRYDNDIVPDTVVIEGNIIGADSTGELAVPNINGGISLVGASLVTIGGTAAGAGNLISGNNYGGNVYLSGSSNNVIEGNLIGSDITGESRLMSSGIQNGKGVVLADGSTDNTVGGTTAMARNIISGNADSGVYIGTIGNAAVSSGNVVEGNFIGTDLTGTVALGNAYDGVELSKDATGNIIGGATVSTRNIISGNTNDGVEITGAGVTANLVAGNYIGTDMTGTVAIGNATGVGIDTSATGNTIGGVTSTPGTGLGNVISGNIDNGVVIDGTGLPAETGLYLKADGNPNNSAINPNGVYVGALLVGGVTYGTGVTGQAFQFNDAAGERVDVNDPSNYLATTAVTLSAWINLSSLPGATPFVIASRAYSATSENYGLYVNSSGELVFEWYSAGAFHTETSSGADLGSRLGAFQQVAVVTDGSTVTFYVNGVAVGSSAMPDPLDDSASGDLEIGGLANGPNLFNGLIDEISVTRDPLPADVIARIYANAGQGTDLGGSGTQDTTVIGNLIGTDHTGTSEIPNGGDGVKIDDALNNTIGGTADDPSNVISGNTGDGVEITGTSATGNVVAGDYIGTDITGTAAIANGVGVELDSGATDNTIGGLTASAQNVISGNANLGISLDSGAGANVVEGNYVGTTKSGDASLSNFIGIYVAGADNTIGGTAVGALNVISGNDGTGAFGAGVQVSISGDDNLLAGNWIGLGANGLAIGGATNVGVMSVGLGNTIGGTSDGSRNVISGQTGGIYLNGDSSDLVEGNYVGTDPTGTSIIGNGAFPNGGGGILIQSGSNDTIGGTVAGAGNLVSGNDTGISIGGYHDETGNLVEGNLIGTDKTGTIALPNRIGINLGYAGGQNTIGGATATPGVGAGNVIAGNDLGINLAYELPTDVIAGNVIGVATLSGGGTSPGNQSGIVAQETTGVQIGGLSTSDENIISGNFGDGILIQDSTNMSVEGNLIGTDLTGTIASPNGIGVWIGDASTGITVGGTASGARNIISGNTGDGVELSVAGTTGNLVAGDFIGTNLTGKIAIPDGTGVEIDTGAAGNTIGGATPGAGNLISGNSGDGIELDGGGSAIIQGNTVGGSPGLGNHIGLYDPATPITLGGTGPGQSNFYGYNDGPGVLLGPAAAVGSSALGERFAGNYEVGILIGTLTTPTTSPATFTPSSPLFSPVITVSSIQSGLLEVSGYALPGSIIAFYASASTDVHGNGEGVEFLGSFVEGSTDDTNATVGTGSMAGANQFHFTFVVPTSITPGMSVTAISGGTAGSPVVSQFAADSQTTAGSVGPTISSGGTATVLVGQPFSYQGFFGDNANTTLTGTANYDDGTGNQALSIQATAVTPPSYDEYTTLATGTYNLLHTFTTPGTYGVTYSILDGDSYTASGAVTVTVLSAPPTIDPGQVSLAPTNKLTDTASPTIVSVDESITISGTFTDANPGVTPAGETDTVTIYWGDGSTPAPATVNQAAHTFTATHIYTAPSSVEAGKGLYAVTATLNDSEGLSTTIGGGKLYAEVDDVPPTALTLGFSTATVAPGGAVSLSGQFQAPHDANDLYDVVVNWGDGTTPTEISLLGGVTTFSDLMHNYQSQPAYRSGTPYGVTVSVNDAYEPLDLATATASVSVVAPTASTLAVNLDASEITEGGMASISGTLTAAVPDDPHVVVIDWGDGTSTDVPLGAGVASFSGVTHPYPLNSANQPGGAYAITATATDTDGAALPGASASALIKVDDIAPTVSGLVVTTDRDLSATTSLSTIVEGSTVFITGHYTKPGGANDGDTIMINWGDGTIDQAIVQPATLTFIDEHPYADLPTGTTSSVKTIIATATDNEGDFGTASIALTVNHPAPVVSIQSAGFNAAGQQMLSAPISGGDTAALDYQWTVNNLVVSTTSSFSVSPSLEVVGGNSTSNVVKVTVTEANNPAETSSYSAQLDLLDIPGQTFVVPAPSQGVDAILVTDLGGNSILAGEPLAMSGNMIEFSGGLPVIASGVTPSSTPLIFDTPETGDTDVGNAGNDVFNEHTDGTVAYGLGGNNIFNLQVNCTLTAVADSGQNTLDFASNTYAITFNMQETEGQTQYVMPGSTDHAVIVNDLGNTGTFSTLDCSNFGDTVTASNGSTIVGGGGMDTVMLSSVSSVTVDASAGGNMLENTAGSTLGNVTYLGDSAAASGSDGAVNFSNDASGTINGTLAFLGDSGATTFKNTGTTGASASISFDGDSAATVFNNTGKQSGSINFDADSGATTLAAGQGSTGAISFDGDGAAASFINAVGAVQSGTISFDGDSGGMTFAGQGGAGKINFDGDNAAATFSNSGTQSGTIRFDGDGGTATFNNFTGSSQTGAISFDGDSGASSFNNNSGAVQSGPIRFDGDSGAVTFANNGTAATSVSFDGDSGAATFANNGATATSATVTFDGDGGASNFNSYTGSTTGGAITFDGDSGSSTFAHNGTTVSGATIQFDGDSGATTFNNNGSVASGAAISFDGDSGANTFNNNSGAVQSGAVAFDGDSAAGTFTGSKGGSKTINFDGDGGAATFNNLAGATQSGTVAFDGDSAAGNLGGGKLGTITINFDGDGGAATFNNYGGSKQSGGITFDGDGATSTFNNLTGANPTGTVSFDGDGGSATFNNNAGATAAGKINFDGDGAAATFNNAGTIATSQPISFDGDGGSSTFNNLSATNQTVAIAFDGDSSAQTFNNVRGATQSGSVSFDGDNTANTFNNSGTVAKSTPIAFDGDNASQTFNNAPGGTQAGSVHFDGDDNLNLYISGSTNDPSPTSDNLLFTGGGNADVFWNQIDVDSLTFTPGANSVSATLVNTGSISTYSIATAGTTVSSIALYNGAIVDGTLEAGIIEGPITFTGGSVVGSLVNDGTITGGVTFIGQAVNGGSSTLLNLASIEGSISFQGDAGIDALTNDGIVAGSITENAGPGPVTLINDGSGVTAINVNGDAAATTATPTVATNRLLNEQSGLATIQFVGGGGGNLLDNQADGVGSINLTSFGANNVLFNSGNNFGQILLNGDGSDSSIFSNGSDVGTSTDLSTITLDENGGTDALINTGSGLAAIVMAGSDLASGLANSGMNILSISDQGGSEVGILLSDGSVGSLAFESAASGAQSFVNGGAVDSLSFEGAAGPDYFENDGTISDFNFKGGGSDSVVNVGTINGTPGTGSNESSIQSGGSLLTVTNETGGTISGVLIASQGALDVENSGAIAGGTEIEAGGPSAKFFSYAGSSLTKVSYTASSGGDVVQSDASVNGLTFKGGHGTATELDLFGPLNENISYYGGTGGDTLGIAASAGNVNNVTLYGNLGTDTINSFATGIQNVTLMAGSGAVNFYNEGDDGTRLSLKGGAGTAVFYNGGPGSTGGNDTHDVTVTAGSGDTAIDSTGIDFGTLTLIGGAGVNYLENDGAGTSSSKIVFIGGTGDNTLDNTGNSVGSIKFTDGTTANGGSSVADNANDTLSNTGNDIGSIAATVNSGELALVSSGDNLTSITATAVGGSSSVTNMGSVQTLSLNGGAGNASLIDTPDSTAASIVGATITFTDLGGTSTFIDSSPAAQATFVAGPVGSQVVIQTGATGPISLTGNTGGDTYTFQGGPEASVSIDQPAATASQSVSNELDFSTFSAGAINLDLEKTGPQNQEGLILNLVDGSGINEVVGAPAVNTIVGNSLVDVLDTEAVSVSSITSASTPTIVAPTQWVYLDFDTYADPIDGEPPQVYTTAERADVLSRLEADYADFPYVKFTENAAEAASVAAADWIVLCFNRTPDQTGQPGGQSSEIDFGSFDPGRYAEIQVNGLIGGPGNPPAFSDGQDNFSVLSAKIAAHELAHLFGVRHSDAFGPIGYGVHTPPGDADFSPDLNGPDAAFETFDHLISSPATQGTTRLNDVRALTFGPREAIKLAFDEQGTVELAEAAAHTTLSTALPFPLSNLVVPNDITSLPGVEQGMNFEVLAGAVSDTIGLENGVAAPNWYSFSGQKGDDFTFETESQILPSLASGGSVDTVLGIYDSSGKLLGYYGGTAENNNQFEGTDSLLDDVILPSTGTFYVEVSSYAAPAGDPMYDPSNPASPLNVNNLTSAFNPASPDFDPAAAAAFLATGNGTAVGSYDLFIYRSNQSNATITAGNTLISRAPGSTLTGTSGDDTLIGTGAGTYIQGSDTVSLTSTAPTAPIDFYDASLGSVLITDTGSMAGSSVTINYGDGTVTTEAAAASISLSHLYGSLGTETITVSYKIAAGGTDMLEIPVTIAGLNAPTVTPPVISSGTPTLSVPVMFSSSITNFYPGDTYQAAWTFTNTNTGTSVTIDETVTTASFAETQLFSTAGTYTVSLQVTNLTTKLTSTVVSGLSPFTISAKVTPTLTLTPTSPLYTGLPYAGAVAVLTAPGGATIAGATVSYTYTNTTSGKTLGNTPPTDVGSYTVAASYAGSSQFNAVSLSPLPFSITPATLNVTVKSVSKPFGTDDSAQLGGTISGILNNDPIVVTFTSPGSAATAVVSATPYAISASDSAPSNPVKLSDYILKVVRGNLTVVPDRTALVLTSSASGGVVFGAPVTFTATVTNLDSSQIPGGSVTISANGTSIGTATAGTTSSGKAVWTLTTSALAAGPYTIAASFKPTASYLASSATLAQTVTAAATTTSLTYSAGTFGQSTTLTAKVTAVAPSTATPSGSVTFTDTTTGAILGTVPLSAAGVATLATATLGSGTSSVTASYAATTNFLASSSSVQVAESPSIYVLNTCAPGALSLSGSAAINVPGIVEVDSSSTSSIELSGAAKVTASKIELVGGSQVTGSASFSVTPTKVASFADPLATLPVPSAAGMKTYAAVNIGGVTVETIGPGIYPSISVGGSAKLTMNPGIYVIAGGGLVVAGAGSLTGSGVMIFNAGSNFTGGNCGIYGGITLSSGSINLSPPTSGIYAGISIFQSSENTKPIIISGAVLAHLGGGVVFAPAAALNISGSAQIGTPGTSVSSLIVNELNLSGAAAAYQLAQGATPIVAASTSNWITDPVLTVAVENDTGAGSDPAEVADLGDAMNYLNRTLESFGVNLSWAPAGTTPDVTIHFATTTPEGGKADGVLGFTTTQNAVYIVTGWNYFFGTDPGRIGPDQFDFTTLATHELAHTLGLGESQDPDSVMFEYLAPGTVRRTFTDDNLTEIDTDSDRFRKVAAARPMATPAPPAAQVGLTGVLPQVFDSALADLYVFSDAVERVPSRSHDQRDAALAVVAQDNDQVPLEFARDFADSIKSSPAHGSIRKRSMPPARRPLI